MASRAAGASSSPRADAIAEEMLGAILGTSRRSAAQEALLLVNGFGGTPLMELYLLVNSARRILDGAGDEAWRATSPATMSPRSRWPAARSRVTLLDDETRRLWDAPVHTAALRWGV